MLFRSGHGPTDWFQIGKGVRQGCILSPCLFNLYAEYIMRNAGMEEAQVGIKISGYKNKMKSFKKENTFLHFFNGFNTIRLINVQEKVNKKMNQSYLI